MQGLLPTLFSWVWIQTLYSLGVPATPSRPLVRPRKEWPEASIKRGLWNFVSLQKTPNIVLDMALLHRILDFLLDLPDSSCHPGLAMPSQGISSADPHRSDFADGSMGIAGAGVNFKGVTDTRIRAALGLIGTSLRVRVNASAIALQIGISRSRFEHLFIAQTGTTFRDYLRWVRLSTARQLLANPCMRALTTRS